MILERSESLDQDGRGKILSFCSLVISSIVAAVFLIGKSGPAIFGDELGYLSAGRVLAGEGAIFLGGGTTYHPGAGLIFSLAFNLCDSTARIYSSVLLLNVIQISIAIFLLSRVLVKLGISDADPLMLAPLLWIFGGLLYYASFAMAEATVCLAFAGLLYLTTWFHLGKRTHSQLALVGFAHGFAWIVHPRFIVIATAFLLSLLVLRTLKLLTLAILSSLVGLLFSRLLTAQIVDVIYDSSSDNLVTSLQSLMDVSFEGIILGILGKLVYLSISSFGFFLFGMNSILRLEKKLNFFKLYLLISIIVVILYTSKDLTAESDPKFFFYGRYLEPLTTGVTLVGIVTFFQRQMLRSKVTARLSLIAVVLTGLFWLAFRNDGRSYQISNSPGFIFLAEISSRPEIYLSLFLFSIALMFIYIVGRRQPAIALTLVGGIAMMSVIGQVKYSLALAGMQPRHAEFVSNVSQIDEEWGSLSVDRTREKNHLAHIHGIQWWASEFDVQSHHQTVNFPSGLLPDVLFHADSNVPSHYELVAADKWTNFSIWVARDEALGVEFRHPKDMSAGSLRGSLDGTFERNGNMVQGVLTIRNRGDFQWFPAGGTFGAMGSIRVVVRVHSDDEVIQTERVDLPRMLWPGQEELLTFEFETLGDPDRITVEGVHEGVRWFSQVGIPPTELMRLSP